MNIDFIIVVFNHFITFINRFHQNHQKYHSSYEEYSKTTIKIYRFADNFMFI